jgi:hypothetical protein
MKERVVKIVTRNKRRYWLVTPVAILLVTAAFVGSSFFSAEKSSAGGSSWQSAAAGLCSWNGYHGTPDIKLVEAIEGTVSVYICKDSRYGEKAYAEFWDQNGQRRNDLIRNIQEVRYLYETSVWVSVKMSNGDTELVHAQFVYA